jgi:hypothetical protein
MGHHEEDSESAEGSHANGSESVAGEVQKGGAERTEAAVGEDAIADSSHAVLPHPEADVSPSRGVSLEVTRALSRGHEGGRRELTFRAVRLEGVKSAEPPMISGKAPATAFRTISE